jgi:hypothetical protein
MGMRHRAKPLRLRATPHCSGCCQSANHEATQALWHRNRRNGDRQQHLPPATRLARVLAGRKSLSVTRLRMRWQIVHCYPWTSNIASDQ